MTDKTDEELENYLANIWDYSSGTLTAVVNELQKRGWVFTDQEFADIQDVIRAKKETEPKQDATLWPSQWTRNLVIDPDAPLYYTPRAILAFSIFFSVFFGAVLLSRNIEVQKPKWIVLLFGLIFTAGLGSLLDKFGSNFFFSLIIKAFGASFLNSYFWNKYIGKDTRYRAKSIKKPIIVALILLMIFIIYDLLSRRI